jgi:peptide/nickel transport system substrate-binding protein
MDETPTVARTVERTRAIARTRTRSIPGALRRRDAPEKPFSLALSLPALSVLFLALLTSCGPAPPPVLTDRPLEVLVSTDAETLDPRYVTDAVGMRVTRLVHAGLTRLDPDSLAPLPYLARTWRWKDERTLVLTLRDGVRFHSGATLTSADVVATLLAFQSPAVGSRHEGVVDAIETIHAEDPLTVALTLKRPHATLLTDLELPVLRGDQAAGPPAPLGTLDGLGPYRVEQALRGAILLSPARDAALPSPRHAVVIRTVHDENARALRLLVGHADVAENVVSPTVLAAIQNAEGLSVTARPGANLTYIVVRMGSAQTGDLHLRRAISMGIARAEIAETLLGRRAAPADTVMPPGHWAYVPSETPFTFDPVGARRELEVAGLVGAHLSLLTSTDRLRLSIARFIAQELGDVGLAVDVTPLELGTLLARLSTGEFDLAILSLPELTEPNVLRVFLHSAFIPPVGSNRGRVQDAELDRLLDEGDRARGVEARRAIYAQVERRIREELFIVPLWHEDQVAVTSFRARTFVPSREGRWLSLATIP